MSTPNIAEQAELMSRLIVAGLMHCEKQLTVELTVGELFAIVACVQLAIRHPQIPAFSKSEAERFIADCMAKLNRLDPVFGEVIAAGNDPAQDVRFDTDPEFTAATAVECAPDGSLIHHPRPL